MHQIRLFDFAVHHIFLKLTNKNGVCNYLFNLRLIRYFVVALIAIKAFIAYLTKYGFRAFGVYRIIVGGAILAWMLAGNSLAMVD